MKSGEGRWGDVEAAYQRRNDLIPNLVETVSYAKFEQDTLTQVIEARRRSERCRCRRTPGRPQKIRGVPGRPDSMSSALSRLLVVVEKYPELKANQSFMDLQHQLEGTENRINVARSRYNKAVETFNGSIRTFPTT